MQFNIANLFIYIKKVQFATIKQIAGYFNTKQSNVLVALDILIDRDKIICIKTQANCSACSKKCYTVDTEIYKLKTV